MYVLNDEEQLKSLIYDLYHNMFTIIRKNTDDFNFYINEIFEDTTLLQKLKQLKVETIEYYYLFDKAYYKTGQDIYPVLDKESEISGLVNIIKEKGIEINKTI